jgi:hypothetical protein
VVPALLILALWVALLAPGVVKWFRNHKPSTSIASFHRQLRLLEHTGPKLVEPAYRLEGEDRRVTEWEEPAPPARTPRLVLLPSGATQKEPTTMRHADRNQDRYEDPYGTAVGVDPSAWDDPWDEPEPLHATRSYRTVRAPRYDEYEYDDEFADDDEDVQVPALSPAHAKSRRKRILIGLGATVAVTFVFGLVPGLGILWAVSLVCAVALAAYLALMFYASNAGLYGNDALDRLTPVARTVISPYPDRAARYDDDDGWESERIAAAR